MLTLNCQMVYTNICTCVCSVYKEFPTLCLSIEIKFLRHKTHEVPLRHKTHKAHVLEGYGSCFVHICLLPI